jgi:hypothetical protein
MEKVNESTLEKMLKDYKPLFRFLKSAEYEPKMKAYGTFQVPTNWFYQGSGEFGHFADTERVLCFNQLTYVLIAESLTRGHVPDMPKMSLEEVYKLQKEGTVLAEGTVRYKKPIISTQPFKGKLEIANTFRKRDKGLLFLDFVYDFEDGKATGESRVALLLRDLQKI